jgi:hypothetical protein
MAGQYIGQDLHELIKHMAQAQNNDTVTATGLITSVDQASYMAKVMLMPWGVETGWLPIGTIAVGNGWGFFHLPLTNTECTVSFQGGSVDNGRILHVNSNAMDAPPTGLVQGEFLLQHQSGSLIHFDNDGNVNIVTSADLTATVGGDVVLSAQGDVTAVVSGDLTAGVQGDTTLTTSGDITAAAIGDIDCTAVGDASLTGTNVTVTAATGVEITGAAFVAITSPAEVTITGANVSLGASTTIDGVEFLTHTHEGVETGIGVSGPVVA